MNTLNGYSKSTLTDKYVLTAAGGHLAVGNAANNIPLNNSTVNTNLNADLLDGTHKSELLTALSSNTTSKVSLTVGGTTKNITTLYASYLCSVGTVAPQTGRTQAYGNVYSYHTNTTAYTGAPTTYTATIGFGKGTAGTVEICGEWTSGRGLWVRALRDVTDNWYAWDRILTEATYSKVLDNRYYTETEINTKLGDYVTLATAQDITGAKRFNKQLTVYTSASSQTPKIVFDEHFTTNWVSEIISDYYGNKVCTTDGFTHGLYIVLGRGNPFDNLNILDSTKTPIARISKDRGHYFAGTMQVTGNVTAPTFIGNLSGNATSANSATNIYVNQHTGNDIEYPLVWSNQTNTNNALENQLYKSYANLLYNPKYNRITASTFKGELFGNFAKRFSFGGGQNNGKYYYVGSITLTNAWQGYHSIWSFTGHERAWSGLLYVGFRLSNTTTAFSGVQVEWLSLTDPTLANSIKMTYEDTESSRVVRIYILLQNYISSSTAFITNSSSSISLSGTVVDSYSGTLYTSSVGPISTSVSADRSITIVPHNNNEINFGGSNTSTTVYIGYRKIDTKPIPTSFVFGNNGAATLTGSGFIKNGSNDNYVLLAGGGATAVSNLTPTNYYWANVKISSTSNAATKPTFSNTIVNGVLTVNGGVKTLAINHNHTLSTAWNDFIACLNPNLTATYHTAHITFGRTYDSKNVGYIGFKYAGNASNSNMVTIGLHSVDNVLNVLASGNVGIGTAAPSQKLHVAGLVNITANSGTLTIGCQNTSYTHYSTTGGTHWFNKAVEVNGSLTPHANNSFNLGSDSKRWSTIYGAHGNFSGTIKMYTGDSALAIYSGRITDAKSDGNICFQTSIDNTDPQSHSYPTQHQARCNISLQPRGGQVYIGTNPDGGNTSYKLYVNGAIYGTSFAGNVAWGNITGKPSFFSGNYNDLTNKPTSLPANGGSANKLNSANLKSTSGLHYYYAGGITTSTDNTGNYVGPNSNITYSSVLRLQSHATSGQLYYRDLIFDVNSDSIWSRRVTNSRTPALVSILHSGNSSVSGGGSSWGSSITVKINDTTATLTIPSNPNTWRPITNSYSGTTTTTSLSQKGANDLYNAVIGSIPTVNNGKITIKQNGTEIGSFTMNQSSAGTINLTDTTYSLVGANGTTGLIKNGSTVTSATGYIACPIINGVPYYKNTTLGNSGVTAGTYTPTPSTVISSTHQSIQVPELAINTQGLITKASLKNVPITGSFYITSNKTLANSDLSFITSIAIAPGYTVTFPTPSASNEGKIIFVKAAYGNSARYVSGKIAACNSICSTASTTTIDIGYYSRIFVCMDYGSGYAWVDYYCG